MWKLGVKLGKMGNLMGIADTPPRIDDYDSLIAMAAKGVSNADCGQPSVGKSGDIRAIQAERIIKLEKSLEYAWIIIANVGGGDWDKQTHEWREAASRFRDEYHELSHAKCADLYTQVVGRAARIDTKTLAAIRNKALNEARAAMMLPGYSGQPKDDQEASPFDDPSQPGYAPTFPPGWTPKPAYSDPTSAPSAPSTINWGALGLQPQSDGTECNHQSPPEPAQAPEDATKKIKWREFL